MDQSKGFNVCHHIRSANGSISQCLLLVFQDVSLLISYDYLLVTTVRYYNWDHIIRIIIYRGYSNLSNCQKTLDYAN